MDINAIKKTCYLYHCPLVQVKYTYMYLDYTIPIKYNTINSIIIPMLFCNVITIVSNDITSMVK